MDYQRKNKNLKIRISAAAPPHLKNGIESIRKKYKVQSMRLTRTQNKLRIMQIELNNSADKIRNLEKLWRAQL